MKRQPSILLGVCLSFLTACGPDDKTSAGGAEARRRADELFRRAEIALGREAYGTAIDALREAFSLAPEREDIASSLVRALLVVGRNEEALEVIREARSRWQDAAGERRIGGRGGLDLLEARALLGLGELEKAESLLRQSLEVRPRSAARRMLLGEVLGRQGKHEEAVRELETALDCALLPGEPDVARESHYQLARSLSALGREREAEVHRDAVQEMERREAELARLERQVHLNPDSPDALLSLACEQCRRGLPNLARRTLLRALDAAPERADLLAVLAVATVAAGEVEEGELLARRSLAERPNATARYALARAFLERGDEREAQREIARAIELLRGDGEPFAQEMRELHERLGG